MNITVPILQCDQPSPITGRTYPMVVVEAALKKFQEVIDVDRAFVAMRPDNDAFGEPQIKDVFGSVKKIEIDKDGQVLASISILDYPTAMVEVAKKCWQSMRFYIAAIGMTDDNNVTTEYEILHIIGDLK